MQRHKQVTSFTKARRPDSINKISSLGSSCGSVDKAVASNTRCPLFESSHRQFLLNIYLLYWKNKVNIKRPGIAHFFTKYPGINYLTLLGGCRDRSPFCYQQKYLVVHRKWLFRSAEYFFDKLISLKFVRCMYCDLYVYYVFSMSPLRPQCVN